MRHKGATTTTEPSTAPIAETFSLMSKLTITQHQILRTLAASADPLRVDDIAESLDLHNNTAREALTALQEKGLVSRQRSSTEGRGRPYWLYQATVSTDPDAVLQEFGNFSAAVAKYVCATSENPLQSADKIGRLWAKEMLGAPDIPDHSTIDAHTAVTHNLAIHAAKIRLFLSRLGFEARPGADASIIELQRCPFRKKDSSSSGVVCAIHQGMTDEIVRTLSRGYLGTEVLPSSGPGCCTIHLVQQKHTEHGHGSSHPSTLVE